MPSATFRTALMRDFITDVHDNARTTDARIATYLAAQTTIPTSDPTTRAAQQRALRTKAAREFHTFLTRLHARGKEHHERIII